MYRVAQLDLIPEIKVLYMLFNRCNIDITKKYPKQHTQYFNFRCKIQLGHPVLVPVAHKLQFRSNFGDGAPLKCRNDMNMGIIHNSIFRSDFFVSYGVATETPFSLFCDCYCKSKRAMREIFLVLGSDNSRFIWDSLRFDSHFEIRIGTLMRQHIFLSSVRFSLE